MSAVVTNKQTGSVRNVAGDTVVLSDASIVTVAASPEDIASYQRSGDDLVLRFRDGRVFRIVNFYAGEEATETPSFCRTRTALSGLANMARASLTSVSPKSRTSTS